MTAVNEVACVFQPCFEPRDRGEYCRGHHAQLVAGISLRTRPFSAVIWLMDVADGWEPSRDEHGCFRWPFSRNQSGYGFLGRVINGKKTTTPASNWLCEMVHGEAPDSSMQAAHSCGRGKQGCVTPEHLSWKTPKQNGEDKVRHGTAAQGERNNKAKLTKDQVRAILLDGRLGIEIAAEYGISSTAITNIKHGRTWKPVYRSVVAEGHTIPMPRSGRRGPTHMRATLSTEEVLEIRASNEPVRELLKKYAASESTIRAIRAGTSRQDG